MIFIFFKKLLKSIKLYRKLLVNLIDIIFVEIIMLKINEV